MSDATLTDDEIRDAVRFAEPETFGEEIRLAVDLARQGYVPMPEATRAELARLLAQHDAVVEESDAAGDRRSGAWATDELVDAVRALLDEIPGARAA